MRRLKKSLAVISILLLATLVALTACDLTGINDALKTDISKCEISFSAPAYEYTGQEIRPDVTVKHINKVLEYGEEYGVEFFDNVEIGTARATISGKGNYKGEVTKDFQIVEKIDGSADDEEEYITYTFSADGAQVISGELKQKVESASEIVLPSVEKLGYEFLYWTYGGKQVDFEDIDGLPSKDATFVARFSIITYTIEYVLYGGQNDSQNLDEYTVESVFELKKATRADKEFEGWYLDSNFKEKITSLSGLARNIKLYARFVDFSEFRTVYYVTPDGADERAPQTVFPNTPLTRPDQEISADGKKKLVWYIDEDMTVRDNLKYMPNEDLTLYARWEDTLSGSFMDRGWYNLRDIESIDSYDDLLAYMEFIYFFNVTKEEQKNFTYVFGEKNIMAEISKALGEVAFSKMIGANYRSLTGTTGSVWMKSSVDGQATLSATQKKDFYPQIGDAFYGYSSNRAVGFDDFAINCVEKEYECATSDQLYYVLSHGYRPLPVSGSPAHRIYDEFKDIMRKICDDRMSDLQKTKAIYDWLILNVYYDNAVAYSNLPQAGYKYDAYYLEGVLNGSAVCDGLSKAYCVMCAIEGIDCVRVTGTLKTAKDGAVGHAWNKVQIMGEWFLTDATWGNLAISVMGDDNKVKHYEYLSNKYFLFTDYVREEIDGYNSDQYSYYVANTQFNYFDNFKLEIDVTKKGSTAVTYSIDLYIDGDDTQGMSVKDEMSYLFEYIDRSGVDVVGVGFCIMFGEDTSVDIIYSAFRDYQSRISKARIVGYSYIADNEDLIDAQTKTYKAGAVMTIVFSLP